MRELLAIAGVSVYFGPYVGNHEMGIVVAWDVPKTFTNWRGVSYLAIR